MGGGLITKAQKNMMILIQNLITLLTKKKMLFSMFKLMGAYLSLGAILLKADMFNWGEYGLIGLVIGAVFYFLFSPIIKMMVEDKKSDNEIKEKLADNIQSLSILLREHILKSESQTKEITGMMKSRDEAIEKMNDELREINLGIKSLNKRIEKSA